MTNEAILSSNGNYTLFSFNGYVIRFRTSSKLERYTKILEWENGYIAVTAKYKGLPEEEEYIDLVPILENAAGSRGLRPDLPPIHCARITAEYPLQSLRLLQPCSLRTVCHSDGQQ